MENLAVLFCCEAPEIFYGLTNCMWFNIRWTIFNKLGCQLVNLHPQHNENTNNSVSPGWKRERLTLVGDSSSWDAVVSVERTEGNVEHQCTEQATDWETRHGSESGGLSNRGRAEKSSSATQAPVQRRNMVHASRCLTEVTSRSWVSVIFFSSSKGSSCLFNQWSRLVVSIYVGVSLQRWANESLVSSMEGGAEAMLLSYW